MRKITINTRVREIMNAKGYDQLRLATEAELTTRTVSELLNGKMKRYPKDALERIADVLGIDDMNDLLTLSNEEEAEG